MRARSPSSKSLCAHFCRRAWQTSTFCSAAAAAAALAQFSPHSARGAKSCAAKSSRGGAKRKSRERINLPRCSTSGSWPPRVGPERNVAAGQLGKAKAARVTLATTIGGARKSLATCKSLAAARLDDEQSLAETSWRRSAQKRRPAFSNSAQLRERPASAALSCLAHALAAPADAGAANSFVHRETGQSLLRNCPALARSAPRPKPKFAVAPFVCGAPALLARRTLSSRLRDARPMKARPARPELARSPSRRPFSPGTVEPRRRRRWIFKQNLDFIKCACVARREDQFCECVCVCVFIGPAPLFGGGGGVV